MCCSSMVIHRYLSDGQPSPTYTLDPSFEVPAGTGLGFASPPGSGLAVDPTSHDLLVADPGAGAIQRYDATGVHSDSIATPSMAPEWVAVAADGSIFAAQDESPRIVHLSGTGTLLGEFSVGESVHSLAVDRQHETLVVGLGSDSLRVFSFSGTRLADVPTPVSASNRDISIDSNSGRLYTTGTDTIYTFIPATSPGVEGPAVSNIAPHAVHVSAEVDPGVDPGGSPGDPPPADSAARFEYSADGGKTWKSTPEQALTSPGPATIEADLTDLLVNFDFLVRVKASNAVASFTSDPVAFSTPETAPEVITGSATDVTETSAVLNGAINPAGVQTSYHFEYGTSDAYGSRIPVGIEAVAGGSRENRIFSRTIMGLTPGTTYHFRLVATNALGTTEGPDRTFTTAAAGEIPRRAYEQVTPVDKQGTPLDPNVGFQAKADGSALAYVNRGGKLSSPLSTYAMSRREANDWRPGIDLSVPLNVTSNLQAALIGGTTLGISDDFAHTFVATNRALTPGANEGGGNLYTVDLDTGTHTLVATHPHPYSLFGFIAVQRAYRFQRGAPDFSWVVFESEFPLIDGAPPFALYRWTESGGLEVASILPNGDKAGTSVGENDKVPPVRTVSKDGSRIYFTVPLGYGSETGVFLYEPGQGTKAVSVSQVPGDPTTPKEARLMGISQDGRYAFLMSMEGPLTPDAPAGVSDEEGTLYRYDAEDGSLEYLGIQGFRGANITNDMETARGVSDDGSTAYLRTRSGSGLAVWRDGVTHYLPPNPSFYLNNRLSPNDGRYYVYETGSRGNGQIGDVYIYDAESDQASCASCLPDGSAGDAFLSDGERYVSGHIPRAVTAAGEVLFTTPKRLVAADVNGTKDVYAFQNGTATLISTGNRNYDATFADMSVDGSNVFFVTNQKLVGQDNDETPDIYDARIGGGFASQNPPPVQECLRDDCKATPGAGPELPFGGSEALSGPGNVNEAKKHKRCGKGKRAKKVKGKVRCIKKNKANKAGKGGNR
ncbi:MAG: hypothetical protein ACJ76B_12550 [Solirubrobacterales bacterium]